jgi:hypothetical protein
LKRLCFFGLLALWRGPVFADTFDAAAFQARYLVSVHKVGYFVDRLCIFSPKGCENAVFKEVCP